MYTVTYQADGARRTFLTNVRLFSLKESECIFEDASIWLTTRLYSGSLEYFVFCGLAY